eukprot:41496-Alexandrium_andersonii.AAC.1
MPLSAVLEAHLRVAGAASRHSRSGAAGGGKAQGACGLSELPWRPGLRKRPSRPRAGEGGEEEGRPAG